MLQLSYVLGPPSIVTFIVSVLARKNLAFVELLTLLQLLGGALSLVLINTSELAGQVTDRHRQQQNFFFSLIYYIYALYMGASWMQGFIVRALLYFSSMIGMILNRYSKGDEISILQGILLTILFCFLVEVSVYQTAKQTAILFAKYKTSQ